MGTKLEFTLDLPGATEVALKVDHDGDGLIDEEKGVRIAQEGTRWRGEAELAGTDPDGILYVYTVTTTHENERFEVTVKRRDTGVAVGQPRVGTIGKGSFYLAHWVGKP